MYKQREFRKKARAKSSMNENKLLQPHG
eukprot:COSAG05_NODE_22892_length_261_cov_1.271605_1_plen_27_part_10